MSRAKRAKKSKVPIKLFLILILLVGIVSGILNYKSEIQTGIASIIGSKVNTYSSNDYVRDIFTESDGTRYLPVVYERHDEQITKADIENRFRQAGIEVERITSSTGVLGTGAKIETKNATYTLLIYGDVNGDGNVNVRDAQKIVQHVVNPGNSYYELTGIYKRAANIENANVNEINIRDAQRIVQFILSKNTIVDVLPESDISRDKEKPVITLNGDKTIKLLVNQEYVELGAEVTDNLDPNVKIEIRYDKPIDTSKPDTYTVIYAAKDASGNTATEERKVIVEEERKPIITYKTEGNFAFNVDDVNALKDAIDNDIFAASATDGTSENIPVQIIGIEDIDISTPNDYVITYIATNSQGITTEDVKIVTIVNPVVNITLAGRVNKTIYNENEKIELDGVTAKIFYQKGAAKDIDNLSKLGEEYKIVIDGFEDRTVRYDEIDANNANIPIKVKVIYTNPANSEDIVYSNADTLNTTGVFHNAGTIRVLGNIREIIDAQNTGVKTNGELYELLKVARVTTKANQQNLTDGTNGKDGNLYYTITSDDADTNNAHIKLDVITDSVSGKNTIEVSLWAQEAGTYKITLHSGTISKDPIVVTISESKVVNEIVLGETETGDLYNGILKAGTSKDIDLTFVHNYPAADTVGDEYIPKIIDDVTANRIKVSFAGYDGITVEFLTTNKNGEYEPVNSTNRITPITGIRLTAKSDANIPNNDPNNDYEYASINMTISVTNNENNTNEDARLIVNDKVRVYPASIYTVSFDKEDITLYLQKPSSSTDLISVDEDGFIYTLFPANMVDQYAGAPYNDPDTKKIQVTDLSVLKSGITNGNIVFIDSANEKDEKYKGNSFIKVDGFVKSGNNYVLCSGGEADYIGIAIDKVKVKSKFIDDEDDRLLDTGKYIKVYHNSLDTEIKIKDIVKKDITMLTSEIISNKNVYCYEEDAIVAKIKTGPKEKDLGLGQLSYDVVEVYEDDPNTVKNTDTGASVVEEGIDKYGNVQVRLVAPNAGFYKIRASYMNDNRIFTLTDSIEVKENTLVSKIGFRYTDKLTSNTITSDNFGIVRVDKPVIRDIVYYHIYKIKDEKGKVIQEIPREIKEDDIPFANKIDITPSSDYGEHPCIDIQKFRGHSETDSAGLNDRVSALHIEYTPMSGHTIGHKAQFTITIHQSLTGLPVDDEPYTQVIEVETKEKAKIVKVVMGKVDDETSLLNSNSPINLYKGKDSDAEEDGEEIDPNDTVFIDDSKGYDIYYTVYRIAYVDEEGDEQPIPINNISESLGTGKNTANMVWFVDNTYINDFVKGSIMAQPLYIDDFGSFNIAGTSLDSNDNGKISYIGIAPMSGYSANALSTISVYLNKQETTTSLSRTTMYQFTNISLHSVSTDTMLYTTRSMTNQINDNRYNNDKVNNSITSIDDVNNNEDEQNTNTSVNNVIVNNIQDVNNVLNNVVNNEVMTNNEITNNKDKNSNTSTKNENIENNVVSNDNQVVTDQNLVQNNKKDDEE